MLWNTLRRLRHLRWHQWSRIVAALVLADQLSPPPDLLPVSEAIIVACIGAFFAPVPVERKDDR